MGKATIIEAQNSNPVYEEGKSNGILGKLKGVFADYKNGTRNSDRLYTEELWDNRVFGSEDVMEALETKTLFGELDHPEGDRCETLAQNAAITITKLEKKPEEGVIYGEAEILDTPTGRIVKALADSGAKLGISSRGMGEEIMSEGRNIIDPETYDFITFDVVVTPANTKARVALTESKHIEKLTESLQREVKECETENQLNQIKTVLENINISNKEDLIKTVETKLDKFNNKVTNPKLSEANTAVALKLIKERLIESTKQLDESLLANEQLAEENTKLIEQNEFLTESRDMLKGKLKEGIDKFTTTNKVSHKQNLEISKLMEENKKLQEEKETIVAENKEILLKSRRINELKIENMEKAYKSQVAKLEESNDLLDKKVTELQVKNENFVKTEEDNSKILIEARQTIADLQNKVKELELVNKQSQQKLTESKLQENKTIESLNNKIKELEEANNKLQESQDRFSHLSFNPIGTKRVQAENVNTGDGYSQEDIALINAMIN